MHKQRNRTQKKKEHCELADVMQHTNNGNNTQDRNGVCKDKNMHTQVKDHRAQASQQNQTQQTQREDKQAPHDNEKNTWVMTHSGAHAQKDARREKASIR